MYGIALRREIKDFGNRLSEPWLHNRQPSRLEMRLDQLLVDNVDPRRCDSAGDHILRFVEEISIVNVAMTREGNH